MVLLLSSPQGVCNVRDHRDVACFLFAAFAFDFVCFLFVKQEM